MNVGDRVKYDPALLLAEDEEGATMRGTITGLRIIYQVAWDGKADVPEDCEEDDIVYAED